MVKIRLKRLGRKHRPFYRVVVTDIKNRRQGAPLVELGYYDPMSRQLKLNKSLTLEWLAKGAQPTPTVKKLIDKADPEGALITIPVVKKERLSKKAAEKAKAAAAG